MNTTDRKTIEVAKNRLRGSATHGYYSYYGVHRELRVVELEDLTNVLNALDALESAKENIKVAANEVDNAAADLLLQRVKYQDMQQGLNAKIAELESEISTLKFDKETFITRLNNADILNRRCESDLDSATALVGHWRAQAQKWERDWSTARTTSFRLEGQVRKLEEEIERLKKGTNDRSSNG